LAGKTIDVEDQAAGICLPDLEGKDFPFSLRNYIAFGNYHNISGLEHRSNLPRCASPHEIVNDTECGTPLDMGRTPVAKTGTFTEKDIIAISSSPGKTVIDITYEEMIWT
jgi:hypothetical protein